MELTITKRDLLRGLTRTHAVADRKSSMPVLANVLVTTDGTGGLRLAATDLYLGVHTSVPARVQQSGSVAVSARTSFDIVKNLPDGEVQWTVETNRSVEIRCGKVRYRIAGMPGEDFPPLPHPGDAVFVGLPADMLAELIGFTHFSMSTDETRPHLAGAFLQIQAGVLRVVTTDGHRLSKAEARLPDQRLPDLAMVVPAKGILELRRLLEDTKSPKGKDVKDAKDAKDPKQGHDEDREKAATIQIATASGSAFFRRDAVQLSVRLSDEAFPPYEKVIPQSSQRRAILPRLAWIEALRRIQLVAADKSGGVRLQLEPGMMRITSENPEVGEGSEELNVDYAETPVTIGFNARYLLDVLGALPHDEVCFEFSGELDPGVVRPAVDGRANARSAGDAVDFVGVVMPMRI